MYLHQHFKRLLRSGRHLAITLLVLSLATLDSPAQAVKGALLGTITDTAGTAAVNATVTITETRTNITSTTTTNSSGNYVFSNLQEGTYRVEASLSGFKRVVRDEVEVEVNTTIRVGKRAWSSSFSLVLSMPDKKTKLKLELNALFRGGLS